MTCLAAGGVRVLQISPMGVQCTGMLMQCVALPSSTDVAPFPVTMLSSFLPVPMPKPHQKGAGKHGHRAKYDWTWRQEFQWHSGAPAMAEAEASTIQVQGDVGQQQAHSVKMHWGA